MKLKDTYHVRECRCQAERECAALREQGKIRRAYEQALLELRRAHLGDPSEYAETIKFLNKATWKPQQFSGNNWWADWVNGTVTPRFVKAKELHKELHGECECHREYWSVIHRDKPVLREYESPAEKAMSTWLPELQEYKTTAVVWEKFPKGLRFKMAPDPGDLYSHSAPGRARVCTGREAGMIAALDYRIVLMDERDRIQAEMKDRQATAAWLYSGSEGNAENQHEWEHPVSHSPNQKRDKEADEFYEKYRLSGYKGHKIKPEPRVYDADGFNLTPEEIADDPTLPIPRKLPNDDTGVTRHIDTYSDLLPDGNAADIDFDDRESDTFLDDVQDVQEANPLEAGAEVEEYESEELELDLEEYEPPDLDGVISKYGETDLASELTADEMLSLVIDVIWSGGLREKPKCQIHPWDNGPVGIQPSWAGIVRQAACYSDSKEDKTKKSNRLKQGEREPRVIRLYNTWEIAPHFVRKVGLTQKACDWIAYKEFDESAYDDSFPEQLKVAKPCTRNSQQRCLTWRKSLGSCSMCSASTGRTSWRGSRSQRTIRHRRRRLSLMVGVVEWLKSCPRFHLWRVRH